MVMLMAGSTSVLTSTSTIWHSPRQLQVLERTTKAGVPERTSGVVVCDEDVGREDQVRDEERDKDHDGSRSSC